MIIMRLFGGLGNQMFQYALARHLSLTHNTDILLEPSNVAADRTAHVDFKLNTFSINPYLVKVLDVNYLEQFYSQSLNYYKEPTHAYHSEVFNIPENTVLHGYWQSERYFNGIRPILLQEFRLKNALREELHSWLSKIKNSHSISLHIRRGDYLAVGHREILGVLPISYYVNAIHYLKEQLGQFEPLDVFVFSDDMQWVKDNLHSQLNQYNHITIHYFDQSKDNHQEEEMYLMSCCKHNIIANSTFSWWGAWLNNHPNKIVIAPKLWFLTNEMDTSGIVPDSWIRLDNQLVN